MLLPRVVFEKMKNIISLIFMNPTEKLLLISFIVLVSVIYAKWSKEYMKPTGKVAGWLVMVLTIVSGVHFIVVCFIFLYSFFPFPHMNW